MSENMTLNIAPEFIQKLMQQSVEKAVTDGLSGWTTQSDLTKMVRDAITDTTMLTDIRQRMVVILGESAQTIAAGVADGVGRSVVASMQAHVTEATVDMLYSLRHFSRSYVSGEEVERRKNAIRRELLGLPELDPERDAEIEKLKKQIEDEKDLHDREQARLDADIRDYRDLIDELGRSAGGKLEIQQAEERVEKRTRQLAEDERQRRRAKEAATAADAPKQEA